MKREEEEKVLPAGRWSAQNKRENGKKTKGNQTWGTKLPLCTWFLPSFGWLFHLTTARPIGFGCVSVQPSGTVGYRVLLSLNHHFLAALSFYWAVRSVSFPMSRFLGLETVLPFFTEFYRVFFTGFLKPALYLNVAIRSVSKQSRFYSFTEFYRVLPSFT